MKKKELSDEEFDKASKLLIVEYAKIVRKGLPDLDVSRWEAKLDRLPDGAKRTILRFVEIDPCLKDALSGKGEFLSNGPSR